MIVYVIRNAINGKVYVGQTIHDNVNRRWAQHRYAAAKGEVLPVYIAMRKHGIDNFSIHVLAANIETKTNLNIAEIEWIKLLRARDSRYGYNKSIGGNDGGLEREYLSVESLKRRRERMLGTARHRGYRHTDETKERIRQKKTGVNYSEETKQKKRESMLTKWRNDEAYRSKMQIRSDRQRGQKRPHASIWMTRVWANRKNK